jgi:hypothetical protein
MNLSRIHSIVHIVLMLVICSGLAGCAGRSSVTQSTAATPTEEEIAAEIYALVVRRLAGPDDTFGGQLLKRTLYLVSETNDAAGDPTSGAALSGPLAAETQEVIASRLADLPASVIWVDSFDEVALDPSTGWVVDDGVIIQLGTIRFESETRALVPGSIYIASLAAGGATYVVELQGDQWVLTGTTGPTWIS